MTRDTPREAPPASAVRRTVSAAGLVPDPGAVTGVRAFEEGLNAVFRVDRRDGPPVVLKAATFQSDAELATEAALLGTIGGADLPVPEFLGTVPAGDALDVAALLTSYCPGRTVPDVRELPPPARRRLVAESGRHLGVAHGLDVADGFGPLRPAAGVDAELRREGAGGVVADPRHDWPAWFDRLVEVALDGLTGAGYVTDDDGRFADLVDPVRRALDGPAGGDADGPVGGDADGPVGGDADGPVGGETGGAAGGNAGGGDGIPTDGAGNDAGTGDGEGPSPALLFGDYRPANLRLRPGVADTGATDTDAVDSDAGGDASTTDAPAGSVPGDGPVIAAVLDVGAGPTADGLLDLALAEDALVDVPFGGTDRAAGLRRALRSAYRTARAGGAGPDPSPTEAPPTDPAAVPADLSTSRRYARYRLYARARHLGAFGYWSRFAREDDPDAVAARWRSFVRARLADLGVG